MTTGKRVLLVDDDATLLQMLGEQLQLHEEFTTIGTKTGAEALELAKADHFDVIIAGIVRVPRDGPDGTGTALPPNPATGGWIPPLRDLLQHVSTPRDGARRARPGESGQYPQ